MHRYNSIYTSLIISMWKIKFKNSEEGSITPHGGKNLNFRKFRKSYIYIGYQLEVACLFSLKFIFIIIILLMVLVVVSQKIYVLSWIIFQRTFVLSRLLGVAH